MWVRKIPRKIPSKFPTKFSKFPCEKSKKNHRRASAGAQGEYSVSKYATLRGHLSHFCSYFRLNVMSHYRYRIGPSLNHQGCENGFLENGASVPYQKHQRKTRGQQLKGKIVSALLLFFHTFPHFFHTLFQNFSPRASLKIKASLKRI